MMDCKGFAERRKASEAKGERRGIGISAYIEACGIAPSAVVGSLGAGVGLWESAQVRFNPTGSVTIFTGSHSHGQGHETTFSQLVADTLGVPIENVEIVHGDTRSEEHTSELQSLMRSSSAVFCLTKKNTYLKNQTFNNMTT